MTARALSKRLAHLERSLEAAQQSGYIMVDVRPGQSWAEAQYLAMLNVKGPAVYVPANKGN